MYLKVYTVECGHVAFLPPSLNYTYFSCVYFFHREDLFIYIFHLRFFQSFEQRATEAWWVNVQANLNICTMYTITFQPSGFDEMFTKKWNHALVESFQYLLCLKLTGKISNICNRDKQRNSSREFFAHTKNFVGQLISMHTGD